jgi:predicted acyltransferase
VPDASGNPPAKPPRLVGLDALRGFDMFWIAGADAFGQAAAKLARGPFTHAMAEQLEHVEWEGFRFYDLIFPLFVFMSGLSLVFSLGPRMAEGGRGAALLRLGRRTALLYLVGIFYYRGMAGWENDVRYLGVLQRIAIASFCAGGLYLFLRPRQLVWTCAGILLGYWALMTLVPVPGQGAPVLEPGKNLAHWVDARFLGGRKWDGEHDPEGLLSTLPAVATCLLGVFAGLLMREPSPTPLRRVRRLVVAGVVLLAAGHLWGTVFPVIKQLWTSSYVLVAGGWSALLLAFFHWTVDIRGWTAWARPFIWIGMNSIAVYLASNLVDFGALARRFVGGEVAAAFDRALGAGAGDMLNALVGVGLCVWFARLLYRNKVFLRV